MSASGTKKLQINKKQKGLTRAQLEALNKNELIDKIVQLEAYNFQLRQILHKKLQQQREQMPATTTTAAQEQQQNETADSAAPSKKRQFDFSKTHKRHVLLKLLYFGWDYEGFACQEHTNQTIEQHLFNALTRSCLIETRASSNYHRCGRTDKEVSAFCQVISIDLRSKFPAEQQLTASALANEIDYCALLNRILPKNIQCIAWMPLRHALYSARFDCCTRTYRYYFPRGDLNIEAMRAACKLLESHADFRNFCKMDVNNGVTNYVRHLQACDIEKCPNELDDERGYSMYYLQIKANAFLWHQIRCIMAVLLLIGQGKEQVQIISDLLNVQANPCKPQYTPAMGLPLNLFKCEFHKCTKQKSDEATTAAAAAAVVDETATPADTTQWLHNEENLQKLIENIQGEWTQFSVKCTMIRNVLYELESLLNTEFKPQQIKAQALILQDSMKPKQYQKLLQRKRCESLENRIKHFVKKQRLVVTEGDDTTADDK